MRCLEPQGGFPATLNVIPTMTALYPANGSTLDTVARVIAREPRGGRRHRCQGKTGKIQNARDGPSAPGVGRTDVDKYRGGTKPKIWPRSNIQASVRWRKSIGSAGNRSIYIPRRSSGGSGRSVVGHGVSRDIIRQPHIEEYTAYDTICLVLPSPAMSLSARLRFPCRPWALSLCIIHFTPGISVVHKRC